MWNRGYLNSSLLEDDKWGAADTKISPRRDRHRMISVIKVLQLDNSVIISQVLEPIRNNTLARPRLSAASDQRLYVLVPARCQYEFRVIPRRMRRRLPSIGMAEMAKQAPVQRSDARPDAARMIGAE